MYRAAWALVSLPLLVLAFTIGRPEPLPAATLPPSFETEAARQLAVDFAQDFANRTPGTQTAEDAAAWVEENLSTYNLNVERQTFEADIPGLGTVQLTNLVARPFRVGPARSAEEIVVVAHRDNLGTAPGANDNASGTAALIELARNLSTVSLAHTVVFVSTDAGAWGNVGAARLAADPSFTDGVLAVVNLDALAGSGPPRIELGGDAPRSPAPVLLATTDASVAAETRTRPLRPSAGDQLLHLAFPFNLYDQTPFLGHGVSALTITSAGDRPPDPATDTVDALDADKLGLLGRSAQALVQSLDGAAEVARGTDSYLAIGGRLIRGFAIEFVLLVALLPPALATVDFAVRMLRRGISFAPAWRSLRSRLIVWLFAGGVAALFAFMGLFPRGDERPIALYSPLADDWPLGAIVGLLAISTIAWFAARVRLVPRGRVAREDELGAHAVMMLTLLAVSAVLAVWNPYSLLLVLPSLHAWLWLPHLLDRPVLLRAVTYAVGFVPLVGLFVSFAIRYELGFDAVWYVATLFSIGYASPVLYVTFLVWAAAAGLAGAIAFGRYGPYPAPGTLGPGPIRRTIARLAGRRRPVLAEWEDSDDAPRREDAFATGDLDEEVVLRGRDDHV